jgi:hypothetical protein
MHNGVMAHDRSSWRAQRQGDSALARGIFRRRARLILPSPRAPRWPLIAAISLIIALGFSLVFLGRVIIADTRPLPIPPRAAAFDVLLPADLADPHVVISFAPVQAPFYNTSEVFNTRTLRSGYAGAGSTIGDEHFRTVPVVNLKGKPIDVSGWVSANTWKVLIEVTGKPRDTTTEASRNNSELIVATVYSGSHEGVMSHFVDDTPAGCGVDPQVYPIRNKLENGSTVQGARVPACKGRPSCERTADPKQACFTGEAVLNYPIESNVTGHVAGMLPLIDVGYDRKNSDVPRQAPYRVIVAGDRYTPNGPFAPAPGLLNINVSPAPSVTDSLQWNHHGFLRAHWSWTDIEQVDRSQEISDIALVMVGVASSLVVAIISYAVKQLWQKTS